MQTIKLQLTDGRDFSKDFSTEENGFLLNETTVKDIGYTNAVGKFITVNGRKAKITCVLKDFNFRSLHEQIQPMIIELDAYNNANYMLLRIEADKTKARLPALKNFAKS
ncbi:MAG: ABC transporter permease [Bacteroidota bacterium]